MNNTKFYSITFMLTFLFILNDYSRDNAEDRIIAAIKDNGCIPHIHIPKKNPKRKQKQMKDIYNYTSLGGE